jgi:hypothetical protein
MAAVTERLRDVARRSRKVVENSTEVMEKNLGWVRGNLSITTFWEGKSAFGFQAIVNLKWPRIS